MFTAEEITRMRPAVAYAALQDLRRRLAAADDVDVAFEEADDELGQLEQQIVTGPVRGADDLMAMAQQLEDERRADGSLAHPDLATALVAGIAAVTGAQRLPVVA